MLEGWAQICSKRWSQARFMCTWAESAKDVKTTMSKRRDGLPQKGIAQCLLSLQKLSAQRRPLSSSVLHRRCGNPVKGLLVVFKNNWNIPTRGSILLSALNINSNVSGFFFIFLLLLGGLQIDHLHTATDRIEPCTYKSVTRHGSAAVVLFKQSWLD